MKPNSKPSAAGIAEKLAPHLRNPTKLRLLLCTTILGGWYAFFFASLSERLTETKGLIAKEQKRVTAAREIEKIKSKLTAYDDAIPSGTNVAELMRHVIDYIRATPLKLLDVKPDKTKEIGPFESPSIRLSIEGTYTDIDELLAWVEKDKRLLRVDSVRLTRSAKHKSHLLASLMVLGLNEKPAADTPKSATADTASPDESNATTKDAAGKPASKIALGIPKAIAKAGEPAQAKTGEPRKRISEVRKPSAAAVRQAKPASGAPILKSR